MSIQADTILDKNLEICDAHHHLWDFPNSKYLTDELLEDLSSGHNIISTIYIECGFAYNVDLPEHLASVGETKFVDTLAGKVLKRTDGRSAVCKAIVGFTDLSRGAQTEESLAAHLEASARFCGVRHATGWDADPNIRNAHTHPTEGLMLTPSFEQGIRALTALDLTFDAWLYHPQISELTMLAKNNPNQIIILDHLGGPIGIGSYANQKAVVFERWRKDISSLAEHENVYIKLGGLAMRFSGMINKEETNISPDQLAEVTAPYYLHAIEMFGVERCMFESNFPVDRVGASYRTIWSSFKHLTKNFSPSEKRALFKGTAEKVYCREIK